MPMACRLASPTMLALPMSPGFRASWAWMRACSSAAFLAFSMASFMNVAACEGWIVLPIGSRSDWEEEEILGCWQRRKFRYTPVPAHPGQRVMAERGLWGIAPCCRWVPAVSED